MREWEWTAIYGRRWMEGAKRMELDGRLLMDVGQNYNRRQTKLQQMSNETTTNVRWNGTNRTMTQGCYKAICIPELCNDGMQKKKNIF
jgi:hypothetical protein